MIILNKYLDTIQGCYSFYKESYFVVKPNMLGKSHVD